MPILNVKTTKNEKNTAKYNMYQFRQISYCMYEESELEYKVNV